MGPWIKRWLDWAMHDLWPMIRLGPRRAEALHFSYEKAGLTVHDQPIPWCAEAVLIEVRLQRLQPGTAKSDFRLVLPGQLPIEPESLRREENGTHYHLFFRLPPPGRALAVELFWRSTSLDKLTLPFLSRDDFLGSLRVQMPALFVRLGEQCVACQTFVARQCSGLLASAVITSPTSLAPLVDLGVQLEIHSERRSVCSVTAPLTSTQLAGRQALVSVSPRKFPRRMGSWNAVWSIGDRALVSQRFRAISLPAFQRSLRVCDTRFLVHSEKHGLSLQRQIPPLADNDRAGPCFLVASREPGMAGLCQMQVQAQLSNGAPPRPLHDQEILITDGPTAFAPGTLSGTDLAAVSLFELRVKDTVLGALSLSPAPEAKFTSEGGFKPADEFIWTPAAEDELAERLTRLMGGKPKE